ncbi:hypothetical protein FisN_3Lh158 [Fistulifera solaris]|uniref:Uncharacterized protein n=1 Tax=Fistulifera solaris TaxID=1519565 RepID=A0A1Z5JIH8_FISSO|nr:hypothetical protein FisN_3Lh158 [Fistulifera solaris]|eukprot:GAX13588.1 hypothetical protein FisN_3Lh158 [Fistulifera solaris]
MKLTTIAFFAFLSLCVVSARSFSGFFDSEFRKTLPCFEPDIEPSTAPSGAPSETPTQSPVDPAETLVIYATGDVPYSAVEAVGLTGQMQAVPSDAELVLHVGDIRRSTTTPCLASEYEAVQGILNQSTAPLLVIVGDNEWNDCSNTDEAYSFFHHYFARFEKQWSSLEALVVRDPVYPEVFSFVQEGVLIIGLNLVGGRVHNSTEWQNRLTYQSNQVQQRILSYWAETGETAKVIVTGHADPRARHSDFFTPFQNFIANTLNNQVPIMYLNGDSHIYKYEPNFLNQSSLLRVMVRGGTVEAPIRIQVNLKVNVTDPTVAFTVLRNAYVW